MGIPFLELLQAWAGCEYLSDLHFIGRTQKRRLCEKLSAIRPETVSLAEWNDALEYILQETAVQEDTAEKAKDALIAGLSKTVRSD